MNRPSQKNQVSLTKICLRFLIESFKDISQSQQKQNIVPKPQKQFQSNGNKQNTSDVTDSVPNIQINRWINDHLTAILLYCFVEEYSSLCSSRRRYPELVILMIAQKKVCRQCVICDQLSSLSLTLSLSFTHTHANVHTRCLQTELSLMKISGRRRRRQKVTHQQNCGEQLFKAKLLTFSLRFHLIPICSYVSLLPSVLKMFCLQHQQQQYYNR